ncbi:hypothetical protein [Streptomyces mirabilis]|uniref:hypothetical protein n=1 Tax=Streptomyces mirabilis TaxID=68239 RepID=UPI0022511571|nr:hypothetical protein [Streptomyces mirabilis]MCX4606966.1 hypothetical protein [Streptomyces mirabilis]MCX4615726.1 hypothetical protein [Streptomyces mirabilis]
MTDGGEAPDMVSFRECARRVVAEGIAPTMTHQRVSQLQTHPDFPPVVKVGRSSAVDWNLARPFFVALAERAAARDSRRRMDEGDE